MAENTEFTRESPREPIAIIGTSLRLPGANNVNEFWELILNGQEAISPVPSSRLDYFEGQTKLKAGFLKVPVDEFDADFWGYSAKDATFMDPQQRILHELIWEALEDAGINPNELTGSSCAIYAGCWLYQYAEILENSENPGFLRTYLGNSFSSSVAKVSQQLGWSGPSIAVETACSSSLVAVNMACESLLFGKSNLALACGVNLLLKPISEDFVQALCSPDSKCSAFSKHANGYVRAEGCSVLVLKRLGDAVKDGDNIWGLIRGSAVAQEGLSNTLGAPTEQCEAEVMIKALKDAEVSPEQVSFLEAHGTGTVVGDPVEIKAVTAAYRTPLRKQPLFIGAVKANIGHTESCSGIAGIIKVLLALKNEIIPGQINFEPINPAIDLNAIPAIIPNESIPWKRNSEIRRVVGVSSFGITGTYAHAIIEEAPLMEPGSIESKEKSFHALKISAKTETALNALLTKYKERLASSRYNENIADIVYSANVGRADFQNRAMILGATKNQMIKNLKNGNVLRTTTLTKDPVRKICFLFSGGGDHYEKMAKVLYTTNQVFHNSFDSCVNILTHRYGKDIVKTFLNLNTGTGSDVSFFQNTDISKIAIFCLQYALLKMWESWGVRPNVVVGHGLGEVCAAVVSGVLSLYHALILVMEESRLGDSFPNRKMLVISTNEAKAKQLLETFASKKLQSSLYIAELNTENQTVVAGDAETILDFSDYLKGQGITSEIRTTKYWHTNHELQIFDQLNINVTSPMQSNVQFISRDTGKLIENPECIISKYWIKKPINFLQATKTALDLGCNIFLEMGPKPVISTMVLETANALQMKNILCLPFSDKTETWETLLTALGNLYVSGVSVNWRGVEDSRQRKKVTLPHYPFERKRYWPEPKPQNKDKLNLLQDSLDSQQIWQPTLLSYNNPVDLIKLKDVVPCSDLVLDLNCSKNANNIFKELDKLVYSYTLNALIECGWNLPETTDICKNDLLKRLGMDMKHRKQFRYLLTILENEGFLQKADNEDKWTVGEQLPTPKDIKACIAEILNSEQLKTSFPSMLLVQKIGENLSKILKGELSALEILFPQDDIHDNVPSAKNFYRDYGNITNSNAVISRVLETWLKGYKERNPNLGCSLRCLEIGAGVGSYTLEILKTFRENNIDFQFYYTDLSSTLLQAASNTFDNFKENMVFTKLNIEEDPLTQGFPPEFFDLIIAGDVIHATKDLAESLFHVNLLLKPDGFFHLYEHVQVSRLVTFIFGLLDGFWRFQDLSVRPNHCFLSKENWYLLLAELGMPVVASYAFGNNQRALLKCVKHQGILDLPLRNDIFSKSTKSWLLFCDEKCMDIWYSCYAWYSYIFNRFYQLKTTGRKHYIVKPSKEFQILQPDIFGVDQYSVADMQRMLNTIFTPQNNAKEDLEGIVYFWTLSEDIAQQEDMLLSLLCLLKALKSTIKFKCWPKLIVVTEENLDETLNNFCKKNNTIFDFIKGYNKENVEQYCKRVSITGTQICEPLFNEFWFSDEHLEVAYMEGRRYVLKLQNYSDAKMDDVGNVLTEDRETFLRNYKLLPDIDSKMDCIKIQISRILRKVLRLNADIELDDNQDFQDIEVDSLTMVEMKADIQCLFGEDVMESTQLIQENNTISLLATYLLQALEGDRKVEN